MIGYSAISDILRKVFRVTESRNHFFHGNYFVKLFDSSEEAEQEYFSLSKIRDSDPHSFRVPKAYTLFEKGTRAVIIMERVTATPLQPFINRYLVSKEEHALQLFYSLGQSLKEFHDLSLEGLSRPLVPSTQAALQRDINKLWRDDPFEKACDRIFLSELDSRLFRTATLHGEAYFTHFLFSKETKKFIVFDLHDMCKGPAFFDLATFTVSLYMSLLLLPLSPKKLISLRNTFLAGYFDEDPPLTSLKLAELYILLRELYKLLRIAERSDSFKSVVQARLKIRKVSAAIQDCLQLLPITNEQRSLPI